jgi:hypothetical protein
MSSAAVDAELGRGKPGHGSELACPRPWDPSHRSVKKCFRLAALRGQRRITLRERMAAKKPLDERLAAARAQFRRLGYPQA